MALPLGITRRQFLLGSGASALLLAAGTTLRHVGEYPKSDLGLRNLSDKGSHLQDHRKLAVATATGHGGDHP